MSGKRAELVRFADRYPVVKTIPAPSIARRALSLAVLLALALSGTVPALAQASDPRQQPCSPADDPSKPLSQKLDQGAGVLCPPSDVDPGMKTPAPQTGKMPVIPPPGSPGGDPSVQPK